MIDGAIRGGERRDLAAVVECLAVLDLDGGLQAAGVNCPRDGGLGGACCACLCEGKSRDGVFAASTIATIPGVDLAAGRRLESLGGLD
jgi:hypothetical protein